MQNTDAQERLTASQFLQHAAGKLVGSVVPKPQQAQPPAPRDPRMCALLVGCNYVGTSNALNGCVNDAINIDQILKIGGADIDIRMLVDAGFNGSRMPPVGTQRPTKANILDGLRWLISDAIAGDKLLFTYSGHGTNVMERDETGAYVTGDAIIPCDFESAGGYENGFIFDQELKAIFAQLPEGVIAHCIADCCHSASVFYVKYTYPEAGHGDAISSPRIHPHHSETSAQIVAISGCGDYQVRELFAIRICESIANVSLKKTSADAFLDPPGPRRLLAQGALSSHILQAMYDFPDGLSYADFTRVVCETVKSDNFSQHPTLTSGKLLDLSSTCGLYHFVPKLGNRD
jgi:hypothetical protein